MYSKYPTLENLELKKTASLKYKKVMNQYISRHNKENENKLRSLNSKNPKHYWRILNRFKDKGSNAFPSLDSLHDHFKAASYNDAYETDDSNIVNSINLDDDSMLNSPFTTEEISKCIKSLKTVNQQALIIF